MKNNVIYIDFKPNNKSHFPFKLINPLKRIFHLKQESNECIIEPFNKYKHKDDYEAKSVNK